jgi:hypothetical protein
VIADTQAAATTNPPALAATMGPASVLAPEGVVSIDVTFLVWAALDAPQGLAAVSLGH